MVVDRSNVDHIMRGLQSTEGVRLHNHRKKLRQRFDIIKKLGQGTYGKVQLGINKETGQEVAIKTIKKCKIETEADLVRIRREIQIMSSVRHPNIIHIYEVFENREKIVLVMEYAAGGELYDYLSQKKVLDETEARRIFRQISTAIYYCHKHKICHRDLKLENILLNEHGSAKIADFGLSNVFDGQRLLSTYCGSPLYASPEIVKGTPYHGPEVDCWSLGVLLYTLVYGAMPFDGSNFKRLVKQISQGDYFEPKKASSASPLIRDMLTVNSPDRATIEQICSHWWVNQGFNVSCLDIAEDLANQTPVRLDLLLSLAPPPENTEKIVVTDDQNSVSTEAPPRSMSVGSFVELDQNAEERVRSFVAREVPSENAANENSMKIDEPAPTEEPKKVSTKPESEEKVEPAIIETEPSAKKIKSNNAAVEVETPVNKMPEIPKKEETKETEIIEKQMEVSPSENEKVEKSEVIKPEEEKPEAVPKAEPVKPAVKVVKKKVTEKKDSEAEKKVKPEPADTKVALKKKKTQSPSPEEKPKQVEKEESVQDKEAGKEIKREGITRKSRGSVKQNEKEEKEKTPRPEEGPAKPMERRKSKIFETAEKFMTNDQKSPTQEKPKKVYIPGVKVSDFAKAFERRSSVPSTTPLKSSPSRKTVIKDSGPGDKKSEERKSPEKKSLSPEAKSEDDSSQVTKTSPPKEPVEVSPKEESPKAETKEETPEPKAEDEPKGTPINDEKLKKLKDSARNIIANALVEDERKKLKKQILKPPVPRTKTEDLDSRKKSLTLQIGKETATVQVHTPENTKFLFEPEGETSVGENKENIEKPKEKKTAKLEITLKSNTLPRRTSKAEVRLSSPQVKKEIENFRTEVEHRVGDPSHVYSTQRSEVAFPVSAAQKPTRSMSLEPEGRPRMWQSRERIIPIQVEGGAHKDEARDRVKELDRPHEGRPKLPYQRTWSLRSNSLSRQSTQDSDTESTMSTTGEPIKKSPREFIIPIAVEGGGYVTPRATSLEPSESMSSKRSHRPFSRKFSLLSDNGSEDESPFSTLRDEPFRLHRLRSSRPTRTSVERADSGSGSEEEEDDDGFELLTAENLFSTLLSRMRSLTQRLNVEDGLRPGFPSSRLLSNHFGPSERLFSNFHQPLTRLPERSEFTRSLSRDLENGSNRFSGGSSSRPDLRNSDSNRSVPRGSSKSKRSDSDTESISESSAASNVTRKHEGRRGKKSGSHSRSRLGPSGVGESEEVTEYVPTFDGNRSLYVPSRMWTGKAHEKRNSDSEIMPSTYRSGIPKLLRPTSLYLEKTTRQSEDRELTEEKKQEEEPKERDFYDILAEKYGITNVIRYDLPRESRTRYLTDNLEENRRSTINIDKKPEVKRQEDKIKKEENSPSSPSTPTKETALGEKYKTPSEKLAMVLNKLEGSRKQEKKEETPTEKKSGKEILPGLSPAAVELYEKTLAEYKKLKEARTNEGEEVSEKSRIPRKVTARHQSEPTFKRTPNEESERKSKTPERSVLSKYFRQSSTEPQKRNPEDVKSTNTESKKKKETSVEKLANGESKKKKEKDVEKTNGETKKKKEEGQNPKSKFLTSLERKLERLRTNSEKKYVDKAIRSLRESSLGPKDMTSENVLIKRAVSLSDCSSYKNSQPGKIQSTVNSVLGMFKKLENSEKKKEKFEPEKQEPEPKVEEKSKIPVLKKSEPPPKLDVPKTLPRNVEPLVLNYNRRPSYFTGNGFPIHRPSSPTYDDSPSYLSPDADSFDSWSNCSEAANLDDFLYGKSYSRMFDDVGKESVSDRIRRKSFYTRFNERKKPRRSSLLPNYGQEGEGESGRERLSYARSFSGNPTESRPRPSYYRSVSSGDEARPRPFYKSETTASPTRRKSSFDWSRPTSSSYLRSTSNSPSTYSSLTLPKNFSVFSHPRGSSLYSSRSPEADRPYSPVRPYSPRPLSPSGFPPTNNFE